MAAFKQFNSQDIIISPLEVNKGFTFQGNALTGSDVGIDRFLGKKGNYLISGSFLTGQIEGQKVPQTLIYDSVKHLYYSNYLFGSDGFISNANTASKGLDGILRGVGYQTNHYNYEQNTVYPNKLFPTASNSPIGVISFPSKLFGDYIQPNSIRIESAVSGTIIDDGQGRLLMDDSDPNFVGNVGDLSYVGNVIYQHGIAIITDDIVRGFDASGSLYGAATYGYSLYGGSSIDEIGFISTFTDSVNVTCSFSSSYKLFETQYKCTLGESEFNYSLNPSTLSGSEGKLYDEFTGSYFDPYITTIGMYNHNYELLAIGKLAKPLPTSRTTDTTILINIDR